MSGATLIFKASGSRTCKFWLREKQHQILLAGLEDNAFPEQFQRVPPPRAGKVQGFCFLPDLHSAHVFGLCGRWMDIEECQWVTINSVGW